MRNYENGDLRHLNNFITNDEIYIIATFD